MTRILNLMPDGMIIFSAVLFVISFCICLLMWWEVGVVGVCGVAIAQHVFGRSGRPL